MVFCSSVPVGAQLIISGRVMEEGEHIDPVVARVGVYTLVAKEPYVGSYSDTLGYFSLPPIYYTDTLRVEVTALGYAPATEIIAPPFSNDSIDLQFQLQEAALGLPTTVVSVQRVGIRVRGDTISFDPAAYLRGNERTLGDLIERIPELALTDNGEITYRGKAIDVLLIDGMDYLAGQQQAATEGLGVEHVLSLELIENYAGAGDFLTGRTDEVALNVVFADSSRGKWVGRQLLATGNDWRSTGEMDRIRSNKNSGGHISLGGRTDGVDGLTARDYLNAVGSMDRAFERIPVGQFNIDDLLPSHLKLPTGLTRQLDFVATLGWQRNYDQNLLRGNLLALQFDRSTLQQTDRRVAGDLTDRLVGGEVGRQQMNGQLLSFAFEPKRNSGDSLARWGGDLFGERVGARRRSAFSPESGAEEGYVENDRRLSVEPRIHWYGPSRALVTLVGQTSLRYTLHQNEYTLRTEQPLLLNDRLSFRDYRQDISTRGIRAAGWLRGQVMVGKYTVRAQLDLDRRDLSLRDQTSIGEPVTQPVDLSESGGRVLGSAERLFGRYSVLLRGEQTLHARRRGSLRKFAGGSRFGAYLRWPDKGVNYSLLSWVSAVSPAAGLAAASGRFSLVGPRNFAREDAPLLSLSTTHRLSYTGQKSGLLGRGSTVRLTSRSSASRGAVVRIVRRNGDFFEESWRRLGSSYSLGGSLISRGEISEIVTVQGQADLSYSWQPNLVAIRNSSFGLDIRVEPLAQLTGRVGSQVDSRRQELDGQPLLFTTLRSYTTVEYTIRRWRGEMEYTMIHTRGSRTALTNHDLTARIEYRPAIKKWSFFIRGVQLLQWNAQLRQNASPTNNAITFTRYDTFPGFLQLGAERLW